MSTTSNNPIPTGVTPVMILTGSLKNGLVKYGTELKIKQVSPDDLQTMLDVLVQADLDFNGARSAQQKIYNESVSPADDALLKVLMDTRKVLATFFGDRWSNDWLQAGFVTRTTAVPGSVDERLGLALRLGVFLSKNSQYEVPALGVTGAEVTRRQALDVSARDTVAVGDAGVKRLLDVRTTALEMLRTEIGMLVQVLYKVLPANDPRWLEFGLNIPASLATPGQPQNVQLAPNPVMAGPENVGPAGILATCAAQPLTTRYRWRLRIAGVEVNYRLVTSTLEPMAMITDLPAGVPVEVIVQAVNGDRQGVASEPVLYTPPVATKTAASLAEPKVEMAPATNGHGSNGHAAGANGLAVTRR